MGEVEAEGERGYGLRAGNPHAGEQTVLTDAGSSDESEAKRKEPGWVGQASA
jgi:hypothetical protein